jgi:putative oxidoreductase
MRPWFYPGPVGQLASIGLLVLRVAMGSAFILHGWPKIQQPFNWIPPEMNMPGYLQALAAFAEFGGGIALILGLLTRLFALGLAITMAVAVLKVHIPADHPYVSMGGPSWELAGVYFACSVLFLLAGPGGLSLDAMLFGRKPVRPAL